MASLLAWKPASHWVEHSVLPSSAVMWPAGQARHSVLASLPKVPGGHGVHCLVEGSV